MGDREKAIREFVVEVIRRTVVNDEYWNRRFSRAAYDAVTQDLQGSYTQELDRDQRSVAHIVGLRLADELRAMVDQGIGDDELDCLRTIVMDIFDLGDPALLDELGHVFLPEPDDIPEEGEESPLGG